MRKAKKNKKGFTLIELLVVIAIIGILATIAVVALQQARQSARDSKRIADIRQIQTALELYYNNNSFYPENIDDQIADANNVYMEMVPTAPTPADGDCDSGSNQYTYSVGGTENSSYTISFCIGGQTGGLALGAKCATPGGIIHGSCACDGETSIAYQGYTYNIVAIGDQCWFAENLRYLPEGQDFSPRSTQSDSNRYYYIYDFDEGGTIVELEEDPSALEKYNTYGILYNWPAAMNWDG